ncbi:MAG TPA: diguanylate cyclase [Clostridiales bacterium UBA8960]|nr:diguanylate cyclase [Clostridiales bacterium UBA8960]
MPNYSDDKKTFTREAIIGLGEKSVRKNYYPELQDKITTLEKMRSRNQALMMAIPDILLVSDAKHHMTPFSTSSAKEATLVLSILRDPAVLARLVEGVDQVLKNRSSEVVDFTTEAGYIRHFEARLQLTEMNEVLIIIRDMTERIALENKLREMAETDVITQLANRRRFEAFLFDREGAEYENFSLIVFDIDGLKNINDALGHAEGDSVIKYVSGILNETFKCAEIIARIGGNEFAIVYLDQSNAYIESKCLEFQKRLAGVNANLSYDISVSFGIAHSGGLRVNTTRLYQSADHNMYNNKLLKVSSSKSVLVKSLMKALEAKDYITEGHADRMTDIAMAIGEAIGLEQHRLDQLALLTKFHDLGKVGIPDNILKKPGPLTGEEWQVMLTHTTIGHRIASASPELEPISDLIYKHHEKWDGTGYPLGLSGEDIPLECRILTIADAFDAMTNDRPYRKALSAEYAIEEILRCSGTQFDPYLVGVFERVIKG